MHKGQERGPEINTHTHTHTHTHMRARSVCLSLSVLFSLSLSLSLTHTHTQTQSPVLTFFFTTDSTTLIRRELPASTIVPPHPPFRSGFSSEWLSYDFE